MTCDPDGIPRPDISWTKDSGKIPGAANLLSDDRVLDITSAKVRSAEVFMVSTKILSVAQLV